MSPSSSHIINNDESNIVTDNNLIQVVKSESNEISSSETIHNNLSGNKQTSNKNSFPEQETDWEDIDHGTTHPSQKKIKKNGSTQPRKNLLPKLKKQNQINIKQDSKS